jgi:hypothetical protein
VVADTLRRRLPSRIMRTNARETPRPVDAAVEECDATAMNWLRRVHALMEGRDMRCKWSMIAACALVGLTAAGAWLYGQQKTGPVADRGSVLSPDKVVYVQTNNGFSVPLIDARFKDAGGRSFVVGQAVQSIQEAGITHARLCGCR